MNIGYARVSTQNQKLETQNQKLETQIERLREYGCVRIFVDKMTGKDNSIYERKGMQQLLSSLREGDDVIVTSLDRIGRSVSDIRYIVNNLESKRNGFIVLDNHDMDIKTDTGKMTLKILGTFAEFERIMIQERCNRGRELARKRGVKFGRKYKLTREQKQMIVKLSKEQNLTWMELASKYNVSRQTIYRVLSNKS